jgi:hypothetical protein
MNNEQPKSEVELQAERNREIILLAKELSASGEVFPFTDINPSAYERIKSDDAEYPGMTTPIDEIIRKCFTAGVKVVLAKDPESGNFFILPAESNDVENDAILPRSIEIKPGMDARLIRLIELDRVRYLSTNPKR